MPVDRASVVERFEYFAEVFANDPTMKDPSGFPLAAEEIDALRVEIERKVHSFAKSSPAHAALYLRDIGENHVVQEILRFAAESASVRRPGTTGTTQYTAAQASHTFARRWKELNAYVDGLPYPPDISQFLIDMIESAGAVPQGAARKACPLDLPAPGPVLRAPK